MALEMKLRQTVLRDFVYSLPYCLSEGMVTFYERCHVVHA
jgi:hypothetical protein